MRNAKKWMAVAGLGLVVVILAIAALPAAAAVGQPVPVQRGGGWPGGGASDQALADALGITLAELQAAEQKAYETGIQQALDKGLITQAQADALLERSGAFGRLHMPWGFFGAEEIDSEALLADALGITAADLQSARLEAHDAAIQQAVTDGQITQEQADLMKAQQAFRTYLDQQGFQDRLRALYEDAVQQAVQAGVLTQAQADAILSNWDTFGGFGHHKFGGMEGFRGRGGMGGFHGRGGMRGFEMPDSTFPSFLRPGVEPGPSL